ncbi:Hypothetical protein (Fragment) [Durusdinium trenchii]|uniref:Protein-tyrosine sulfotransferase n=1 Tax=Durusdinium trenchii TaxID=1381693 RepID=A0ABP0RRL5_9DINO
MHARGPNSVGSAKTPAGAEPAVGNHRGKRCRALLGVVLVAVMVLGYGGVEVWPFDNKDGQLFLAPLRKGSVLKRRQPALAEVHADDKCENRNVVGLGLPFAGSAQLLNNALHLLGYVVKPASQTWQEWTPGSDSWTRLSAPNPFPPSADDFLDEVLAAAGHIAAVEGPWAFLNSSQVVARPDVLFVDVAVDDMMAIDAELKAGLSENGAPDDVSIDQILADESLTVWGVDPVTYALLLAQRHALHRQAMARLKAQVGSRVHRFAEALRLAEFLGCSKAKGKAAFEREVALEPDVSALIVTDEVAAVLKAWRAFSFEWDRNGNALRVTRDNLPAREFLRRALKSARRCTHRHRVFGIGMFKTATTFTADVVQRYGFRPGIKLFTPPKINQYADGPSLRSFLHSDDPIGKRQLNGIWMRIDRARSSKDAPTLFLFRELHERFPRAKFVMTHRDPISVVNSDLKAWARLHAKNLQGLNLGDYVKVGAKAYGYPVVEFLLIGIRRYFMHDEAVARFFHDKQDQILHVNVTKIGGAETSKQLGQLLGCNEAMVNHILGMAANRRRAPKTTRSALTPRDIEWLTTSWRNMRFEAEAGMIRGVWMGDKRASQLYREEVLGEKGKI